MGGRYDPELDYPRGLSYEIVLMAVNARRRTTPTPGPGQRFPSSSRKSHGAGLSTEAHWPRLSFGPRRSSPRQGSSPLSPASTHTAPTMGHDGCAEAGKHSEPSNVRKLVLLGIVVIIIRHRRRPVPSCHDLVGDEQARLLRLLDLFRAPPEPFARQMNEWRRYARVVGLMHLANNHPTIKV